MRRGPELMGTVIRAIRGFLPLGVLTNEALAPDVGWTPDAILAKTGIAERHVAEEHECASDLAFAAVERLLRDLAVSPDTIDFLINCSQTTDYILPTTACILQHRLGLDSRCMAFDLNQGCSGYIYSLGVAHSLISTGMGKRGLVLTADTYSKYIHPKDRSVRTLFGDGATATLLELSPKNCLEHFVYGTDGSGARNLIIPAGGSRQRTSPKTKEESADGEGNVRSLENLVMNGPEIFAFSLRRVPEVVASVLAKAQLSCDQIEWYAFHQANRFMLEHLRKKIGIKQEKMLEFLKGTGNTTSSTIPLMLEDAVKSRKIMKGDRILLAGFGVGYSWGGCIVTWEG